nr:Gfo/Idh/MocA family oxidoreductase [Actibacterium sp. 188UL27-1]
MSVAVLGAGYFAQFHYDGWARIEGVQLIGSADRDLACASATGLPAFADLADMLTADVPDILDIATPPPTHAVAISQAIAAGVGTIICQKPFCTSLDEARKTTAAARAAGATLVVHENFRFQPWYRVIKTALDAGKVGDVHQITFRLRTGDGQDPRAYLDRQPYFQTMPRLLVHETAVHWIDTFRYLLGDPTAVYADLRRMNPIIAGEDAGYLLFDHGPARALFDGNRLLDHDADNHRMTLGEALVEGTAGTLTLTGDGAVHFRAFGSRGGHVLLAAQDYPGFAGDCVHALQAHVVDAIRTGQAPENTAADYLTVREIEEAVYRSAEEGRKIQLPR